MRSGIQAVDWYRNRLSTMTLNGVIAVILRHFTEFGPNYVTVVQVRPTWSEKNLLVMICGDIHREM